MKCFFLLDIRGENSSPNSDRLVALPPLQVLCADSGSYRARSLGEFGSQSPKRVGAPCTSPSGFSCAAIWRRHEVFLGGLAAPGSRKDQVRRPHLTLSSSGPGCQLAQETKFWNRSTSTYSSLPCCPLEVVLHIFHPGDVHHLQVSWQKVKFLHQCHGIPAVRAGSLYKKGDFVMSDFAVHKGINHVAGQEQEQRPSAAHSQQVGQQPSESQIFMGCTLPSSRKTPPREDVISYRPNHMLKTAARLPLSIHFARNHKPVK